MLTNKETTQDKRINHRRLPAGNNLQNMFPSSTIWKLVLAATADKLQTINCKEKEVYFREQELPKILVTWIKEVIRREDLT